MAGNVPGEREVSAKGTGGGAVYDFKGGRVERPLVR